MVLRSQGGTLFVRKLVPLSAAENAGIMPGDCVVEVDGTKLCGRDLNAATRTILGPIGSVATIVLIRTEGGKKLKIELHVVRDLKATAEPEYKLQSNSDKCTTQILHLECLQHTTEGGQHKSEQTQVCSEPKMGTGRKQMGDTDTCDEAKPELAGDTDQHGFAQKVERTEADNEAVDFVLQGCELKLRRGAEKWTRVCARAHQGGRLSWRTQTTVGKNVLSANCMWCGVSSSHYTPEMSAKEFDEMNRKFYVMVEDRHLLAHATDGAVFATQGTKLEFLAESEKRRDAWIKGINVLIASNGDFTSSCPASSGAVADGTVVRRIPLLPQLRHKKCPRPCHPVLALPKVAAQAREAATAALNSDRVTLEGYDKQDCASGAAFATGRDLLETAEVDNYQDNLNSAPGGAVFMPSKDATKMAADFSVSSFSTASTAVEDGKIMSNSGGGDGERLAGIPMSRVPSLEAAARLPAQVQQNLEEQWQQTANKCSVNSLRDANSDAEAASPTKMLKIIGGGGRDLQGILAARRRAQAKHEDDGFYF